MPSPWLNKRKMRLGLQPNIYHKIASTMQKESLVPIPIGERIETVDIIRGIALLGIVIINFTVDDTRLDPWNGYAGISNQLAYWPIVFFLDDKFVAMFSFLFGLGFAIQMERAEARNANFVLFYIKRLFVLFLIGAVHQILTGSDILNEYAFLGFLLLPLRKMNLKYLPLLAVICIIIPWTRIAINENPQWFSNNKQILINPSILNS
jgi:uncharacterized protein